MLSFFVSNQKPQKYDTHPLCRRIAYYLLRRRPPFIRLHPSLAAPLLRFRRSCVAVSSSATTVDVKRSQQHRSPAAPPQCVVFSLGIVSQCPVQKLSSSLPHDVCALPSLQPQFLGHLSCDWRFESNGACGPVVQALWRRKAGWSLLPATGDDGDVDLTQEFGWHMICVIFF